MASPYPVYAFHVLESSLLKQAPQFTLSKLKHLLGGAQASSEDPDSPLFITWNILTHGSKQLRGCIGTFSPLPVEEGISDYALTAAFEDPRFSPIKKAELSKLSVSVTLLQHFEEVSSPLDWELGKHGIRIKFHKNGRSYGATFLPDVAEEQGWDKLETLNHLVAKAGYRSGEIDLDDIKVTRYQGLKTGIDYEGYKNAIEALE